MLPPREPSDDAALVRRLQTGTREQVHAAFQVLVERYEPRLFLHLAAKGLTHPEQQDVANETWERAWRLISDFEYRGIGIFAWLRAAATLIPLSRRASNCDSVTHLLVPRPALSARIRLRQGFAPAQSAQHA